MARLWLVLPLWVGLTLPASAEDAFFTQEMPRIIQDKYLHTRYNYNLYRSSTERQGTGELWLSFERGLPRLRLRGVAHSAKFGKGVITLVMDSTTKTMYAQISLQDLNADQCVKYAFPDAEAEINQKRLKTLRWRREQVKAWQVQEASRWGGGATMLPLNWTKSYSLGFVLTENNDELKGVKLQHGTRLVKEVSFEGTPEKADHVPEDDRGMFLPPSEDCRSPSELTEDLAQVDLKPPHQKSSALNDLLLLLTSSQPVAEWSQLYLLLSSIILPGDIAVMLEDPAPPSLQSLQHIAFDYNAVTASPGGHNSQSRGSIWINMHERAFRLRGNANGTKIGDLQIDLIARGGDQDAKIYAHVKLSDQDEEQCVSYAYPTLAHRPMAELEESANIKLTFFSISEIDGEDCAIFVAPLARQRWIHIWVDMEADDPDAFLRSEIHHKGKVLRTTDVLNWRAGDNVPIQTSPASGWHCDEGILGGQLAHLDIRNMHRNSIQLQDALYALHELSPDFAVREILGVTGDVAIIVKVPQLPNLQNLPSATFDYSIDNVNGDFALDLPNGKVRATAISSVPGDMNILMAMDVGRVLAVKIMDGTQGNTRCLKIDLQELSARPPPNPDVETGIFDKVESVDGEECNHFSFVGAGSQIKNLDFWYSEEEESICRIRVKPRSARPTTQVDVSSWQSAYQPDMTEFADFEKPEDSWVGCEPATLTDSPWLSLASYGENGDTTSLPTAAALSELGQALGAVGLLPSQAASDLSRMVVKKPTGSPGLSQSPTPDSSGPPADAPYPGGFSAGGTGAEGPGAEVPEQEMEITPPPSWQNEEIFSPLLKTFTFSFTSTYPLQGESTGAVGPGISYSRKLNHRERGMGEVRVDVANRRLYLRSEARNISEGIPRIETKVIYRADQGRLWARTKIMGRHEFQQCWQISTAEVLPLPPSEEIQNPFLRAKLAGSGFSIPGAAGDLASKYVFFLDASKRVELYVDDNKELAYINLDHLDRDVSAGVIVRDWSTAPFEEEWFEPGEDWNCAETQSIDYAEQLAEWELIQIFLPTEPDEDDEVGRRLDVV